MKNIINKFDVCINSPNLGKRHQCLIDLIAVVLPMLNDEIGEIGDAAINELLEIQKRDEQAHPVELRPFSSESDNHNTYLYIVLGRINNNDQEYNVGIRAETPWKGDWDYLGWGDLESMPYDIRTLSRKDTATAAQRLALAILMLDEVFKEPGSSIANMALELKKSGLFGVDD